MKVFRIGNGQFVVQMRKRCYNIVAPTIKPITQAIAVNVRFSALSAREKEKLCAEGFAQRRRRGMNLGTAA